VEAYQLAAREWPWMGMLNYWFLRRPSDAERDQAWYYFRLLEPDFTPLPAYGALAELATQPPAVDTGYHQEDHWALHYEGVWEHLSDPDAVLGAYARGQQNATVSFHMEGSALAVVLRDAGKLDGLQVIIDGHEQPTPQVWNRPTDGTPAVTVARGLEDTRHEVLLRVAQGPVELDGLVVWHASAPWARPEGLLWLCGVLGALCLLAGLALQKRAV
jgi:hypothetical protein